MRKRLRIWVISVVALLVLVVGVWWYAYSEEVVLTTYYPAPYGKYNKLQSKTLTVSDNVGIGTTTPSQKLEVSSDQGIGIYLSNPNVNNGYSYAPAQVYGRFMQWRLPGGGLEISGLNDAAATDNPPLSLTGLLYDDTKSLPAVQILGVKNFFTGVGNVAATAKVLSIGTFYNHDLMTILGDGKVGIGTASPAANLHVVAPASGNIAMIESNDTVNTLGSSLFIHNNTGGAGGASSIRLARAGATRWAWVNDLAKDATDKLSLWQTGALVRMTVDSSGNVGIGTTGPGARLQLQQTSAGTHADLLALNNPGTSEGSGTAIYMGYQDGGLGFFGARILQVGVPAGIRSSDLMLQVHDDSHGDNADSSWITGLMVRRTSGNVGIGTTTPGYKLDVNGSIRGYGITDSSDLRQKKDVQPLSDSLDKILALRGVRYQWKDSSIDPSPQIGLIGQEVENIYPELVKTDAQGQKSLNYSHLVAPLIEAIKEQQKQIASSREETNALKQENTTLKEELSSLKKEMRGLQQAVAKLQGSANR